MPVSIRNTDILFNDNTTVTSLVPAVGAVGSYAFMSYIYNDALGTGGITSGSNLRYRGVQVSGGRLGSGDYVTTDPGNSASGTWKLMGYVDGYFEYYGINYNHSNTCSLWLRIS
jgi:hypothetical protein